MFENERHRAASKLDTSKGCFEFEQKLVCSSGVAVHCQITWAQRTRIHTGCCCSWCSHHDSIAVILRGASSVLLLSMASLDLSAQSDALDPIFAGLKSRNAETRAQSAEDLGKHVRYVPYRYFAIIDLPSVQVQILVRELSSDAVQKLWEANISKRLVHLVNAQSSTEKHGGLLAIGAFFEYNYMLLSDAMNIRPSNVLGGRRRFGSQAQPPSLLQLCQDRLPKHGCQYHGVRGEDIGQNRERRRVAVWRSFHGIRGSRIHTTPPVRQTRRTLCWHSRVEGARVVQCHQLLSARPTRSREAPDAIEGSSSSNSRGGSRFTCNLSRHFADSRQAVRQSCFNQNITGRTRGFEITIEHGRSRPWISIGMSGVIQACGHGEWLHSRLLRVLKKPDSS